MPFGSFFFAAVSSEMVIKFYEYEQSWKNQEKVCSWLKLLDEGETSKIRRKAGRPSLSSSYQTSDDWQRDQSRNHM